MGQTTRTAGCGGGSAIGLISVSCHRLRGGSSANFALQSRHRPACVRRIEVRMLIAIMMVALLASSSAFARKASQHHSKRVAPKHQSTTKTDPGGVARDPNDVALDRKIGNICKGC